MHGENILPQTLFMLAMWDALFATPDSARALLLAHAQMDVDEEGGGSSSHPLSDQSQRDEARARRFAEAHRAAAALDAHLPYVVKHPWQVAPSDFGDLMGPGPRAPLFHARLAQLRRMSPCALAQDISRVYRAQYGAVVPRVRWETFALADLVELVHAAGAAPIVAICSRLCESYLSSLAGLPDVTVWQPLPCTECDCGMAAQVQAATPDPGGVGVNGAPLRPGEGANAFEGDWPVLVHHQKQEPQARGALPKLGASSRHGFMFFRLPPDTVDVPAGLPPAESRRGRFLFTKTAARALACQRTLKMCDDAHSQAAAQLSPFRPSFAMFEAKSGDDRVHPTQLAWIVALQRERACVGFVHVRSAPEE